MVTRKSRSIPMDTGIIEGCRFLVPGSGMLICRLGWQRKSTWMKPWPAIMQRAGWCSPCLGFTLFMSVAGTLFILILGERTNRALARARDNLEGEVAKRTAELQENQEQLAGGRGTLPSASGFRRGGNLWRRPGRKGGIHQSGSQSNVGIRIRRTHRTRCPPAIHHSHGDGTAIPKKSVQCTDPMSMEPPPHDR